MPQPKALIPLSMSEMFERFGVYIIQGLLVLYFTNYLGLSDTKAYITQANFSALVYIFPVLGGLFADRILGHRYAILLGAIPLIIGYFMLAVGGSYFLYLSLALIVLGTAFIKPNISTMLGEFYHAHDPRREPGFTFFYMGLNVGILLSTASSGFIQEHFGWSITFGTAGIGIIIGTLIFCLGFKYYENRGLPPKPSKNITLLQNKMAITGITMIGALLIYILFWSNHFTEVLLLIGGILTLIALIIVAFQYERHQRNKLLVLILLIFSSIIFWGLYWQIFSSVNLFVERNVDRHISFHIFSYSIDMIIPPTVFLSLIAIYILLLGPLFAKLWNWLYIRKKDFSFGVKFSLALFSAMLSMFILSISTHHLQNNGLISIGWIFLFYLFITIGELFISPIGLSMVTELAPPNLTGLMMGVWFMALGFGGTLSGYFADKLASIPPQFVNNISMTRKIYGAAFADYAIIALIASFAALIFAPWLNRMLSTHRAQRKSAQDYLNHP